MSKIYKHFFIFIFLLLTICNNKDAISYQEKIYNRIGFAFNANYQLYAGQYRELTKNTFYNISDDDFIKLNDGRIGLESDYLIGDKKGGISLGISFMYDVICSINDYLSPFIGLGVDVNFPITTQKSFFQYTTNLGNFGDVWLRIGNIFKVANSFSIGIYGNGGLASVMWIGNGSEVSSVLGLDDNKYDLETQAKFGIGYMVGGGIDFIIAENYFIGVYYNYRKILKGKDGIDATSTIDRSDITNNAIYNAIQNNQVYTSKYEAHTIGMRLGAMIKF